MDTTQNNINVLDYDKIIKIFKYIATIKKKEYYCYNFKKIICVTVLFFIITLCIMYLLYKKFINLSFNNNITSLPKNNDVQVKKDIIFYPNTIPGESLDLLKLPKKEKLWTPSHNFFGAYSQDPINSCTTQGNSKAVPRCTRGPPNQSPGRRG